ncbi:MAG: TerD family protein [Synergistaceae bacterium]|jgi:stress response protein SCP2|nr:TerD family protein [Synergistaceae bacterium]
MSVNLQKGQKVDLTKGNAGLKKLMAGLGWDEAPRQKGGLLSGILGGQGGKQDIDCDAMAFLLGANGKLSSSKDVVFFNNLKHPSGCVTHQGDNLTGAGEGDDEQILIDLLSLPKQYERIVIAVSIYKANERNQHFGMIKNAFIRLVDVDTNKELCKYDLSDDYPNMTAMIFGEVYRYNGEWKFGAIGEGLRVWSVTDLSARYGLA